MLKDVKKKLSGGFQFFLLVGRAIEKFEGTKQAALQSFIIPFALFPVSIWFAMVYPPKGMETGYPASAIFAYVVGKFLISLIFTLVALSFVARLLKREDKFWLLIEAINWAGVAMSIVALPFMLAAITGTFPREEMDHILALFSIYGYVVTACIVWRAFQTFWQIAGAVSILTLFITQETGNLLYAIMGVEVPMMW